MAIADNSILRAAVRFALHNASDIVNVYHFVMDSVGDVSEANVLADILAYANQIMNNMTAQYSSSLSMEDIEVWVRNTTLDRWDYVGAIDGTWVGTGTVDQSLPVGVSVLATADTTDSHAKGRKYWPPPIEAQSAGGLYAVAFITQVAAAIADWIAVFTGTYAEWAPGVWSEKDNNFKLFTGTGTTNNVAAYQRRRKPGVGS